MEKTLVLYDVVSAAETGYSGITLSTGNPLLISFRARDLTQYRDILRFQITIRFFGLALEWFYWRI